MGAAKRAMMEDMAYEESRNILLRMMALLRENRGTSVRRLLTMAEEQIEDEEAFDEFDRLVHKED